MILAEFLPNPQHTSFENQEVGEKIILLLRAHIITLVPAILLILTLLLTPILVLAISSQLGFNLDQFFPGSLFSLTVVSWYLFTAGYTFLRFLLWFFNVYLVTNERLVDFDFFGFLLKAVSETRLTKIQDVTSRIYGVIRTIFNFGDVFVQTAGTEREFEFHAIPRPDLVARIISEEIRKEEAEAPGEVA